MKKRLDYLLSNTGVASRADVKKMIRSKRITVDDQIVTDPSEKFDPELVALKLDGQLISFRTKVYLMMNKPDGVICATEDKHFQTVCDLLPKEYQSFAPYPVGRLDRDTEGFVLLSNDGDLAHRIISPKYHIPKQYYATIEGMVTAEHVSLFAQGITLEDGTPTLPAQLTILSSDKQSEIKLVIYEGKFHQVKRMFTAIGCQVTFLKRLSIGPLHLDETLPLGHVRELTEEELILLKHAVYSSGKSDVSTV